MGYINDTKVTQTDTLDTKKENNCHSRKPHLIFKMMYKAQEENDLNAASAE